MRVGVVDLGGNTARLLVAEAGPQGLERLVQERVVLGLGAEIERRGRISRARLAEAAGTVAALYARARDEGCGAIEVLVTSPGRRTADRIALARAFTAAGPMRVRFVSPHEEARLAYVGARALGAAGAGRLAVCGRAE